MGDLDRVDARSVAELLLDAEYTSRQLLLDVAADRTEALVWGWGEVLQAAGTLWAEIPVGPAGSRGDPMRRLQQALGTTQVMIRGRAKPPPADPQLEQISTSLLRAAELVRTHPVGRTTDAQRADIEAAKLRVMHVVYLATHAVVVSVREDLADRHLRAHQEGTDHRGGQPVGATLAGTRISRLSTIEQIAGSYIDAQFPTVLAAEKLNPSAPGRHRLTDALIEWDTAVHTVLPRTHDATTIAVAARTQTKLTTSLAVLLRAAAATDVVSPACYQRLGPALEESSRAWAATAARWSELLQLGTPVDRSLIAAGRELGGALVALTHDQTGWATPQLIASRVDLAALMPALGQSLETAPITAALCAQATDAPDLVGPARPMAARLRTLTEEVDATAISPAAISTNRIIPVPATIRDSLHQTATGNVAAAEAAAGAATVLTAHLPDADPPYGIGRDADRRTMVFPGHVPWHPPKPRR